MRRLVLILGVCMAAQAHDIITTPITFDREILRIIHAHCASCHHDGGPAFSLLTYQVARPWAEAIKEEVLARTMPPWGAIKGFGDFRNDQALTPEEMELVVNWVDGGVPEGEEKDLPPPAKFGGDIYSGKPPSGAARISGDYKLLKEMKLGGLWPVNMPAKASIQITAALPDGSIKPLLWLDDYSPKFAHAFLFRETLDLPAGTVIRGVPTSGSLLLLKPQVKAPEPPASALLSSPPPLPASPAGR